MGGRAGELTGGLGCITVLVMNVTASDLRHLIDLQPGPLALGEFRQGFGPRWTVPPFRLERLVAAGLVEHLPVQGPHGRPGTMRGPGMSARDEWALTAAGRGALAV